MRTLMKHENVLIDSSIVRFFSDMFFRLPFYLQQDNLYGRFFQTQKLPGLDERIVFEPILCVPLNVISHISQLIIALFSPKKYISKTFT